MTNILRDLRVALSSLRRSPGFTIAAIITLGLGVGANTSAFSILNALLLRPLPYADAGQLERIYRATDHESRGAVSPADYLDLTREMNRYGEVAAYGVSEVNVSEPGAPAEMAAGVRMSTNLLSTLGTRPERGRDFRPDEEIPGNDRVVILGYRYWRTRFGGDPGVIGREVRVDGHPHEIVGVLSYELNDWRHLGPFDVFRPLALSETERADRRTTWLRLVGRRSAVGPTEAAGFVAGFGQRLAKDFPEVNTGASWRTLPMYDSLIPENAKGIVGMLIGLSAFVLLIACSNLANLLLARTVARAREFAVRAALGASRVRLLTPLFLESVLLAIAGGLCAVQVAIWTHDWLNALAAQDRWDPPVFNLDWRVLIWAGAAGLATVLVFGFAPAVFALRLDLNATLKSGSRGMAGDRGYRRFRQVLIAGQFALAMVLLAGAAIFMRGLHEWNNRQFGWDADRLVTGTVLLPAETYRTGEAVAEFQRRMLARLETLPGVASASLSYSMPFFGLSEPRKYLVEGREAAVRGQEPAAVTNGVTPRYFETVGTRIVSGRPFTSYDTLSTPKVFIINQAMAHGLFGRENPIGRRIAQTGRDTLEWGEIVGVAADIQAISSNRLAAPFQVYQPMAQEPRHASQMAVRTAGSDPSAVMGSIRTTMMSLDRDLPVRQLQPARNAIAIASNYQWIIGRILSLLGLLGLGLACLGIYGVIARATAQRAAEFGIRLALGAQTADITRLVLTSGAKLAVIGAAIGIVGAVGITRIILAAFPGLQTSSAPTLAAVTMILVAVALAAGYVPARIASRISPTEALRAE